MILVLYVLACLLWPTQLIDQGPMSQSSEPFVVNERFCLKGAMTGSACEIEPHPC